MTLATMAQLLTLTTALSYPPAGSATDVAQLPQPIATRQNVFFIPFQVGPPQHAGQQPLEVQLWCSRDHGATWKAYHSVLPSAREFTFQAPEDGEYWFAACTMDRSRRLQPQQIAAPEMRVVVDTQVPQLQLWSARGEKGEITVWWQIDEPNLKAGPLKLEYRGTNSVRWQPVAINLRNVQTTGSMQRGHVMWRPRVGPEAIQVRAEISDIADNRAVAHQQVGSQQIASSGPSQAPVETNTAWRRGGGQAPAPTADPRTPQTQQADPIWGYGGPPVAVTPVAPGGTPNPNAPNAGGAPPWADPPGGTLVSQVSPPYGNQFQARDGAMSTTAGGQPAQIPQRVENKLYFYLQYDDRKISSPGAPAVEVWGTRDGGQTWQSYGLDKDRRSPIMVKVDVEGEYGFQVVASPESAQGSQRPLTGQFPDVIVKVDLTRPTARIVGAGQGTGAQSGSLVIAWEAEDNMALAARPISLFRSVSPAGPWTPIAENIENTRRYVWPMRTMVSHSIFLRLEVRDEAGNVGSFETNTPTTIDRRPPSVHMQSIHPTGQSQRTPPRRYSFQ